MEEEKVLEPEISEEIPEDFPEEQIVITRKRTEKLGDIMTMQCVFCILLAIVFVLLNGFLPKYSEMISRQYREQATADDPLGRTLASMVEEISNFMNQKPEQG